MDSIKATKRVIQNIFLADDDPDDRDMFCEALKGIDQRIKQECVGDGAELLDLLKHFQPDMLFLDLEMPNKNGLECLKEIHSSAVYTNLPIVVFSSTSRKHNIDTAYEMGAHLFISKPHSFYELQDLLKRILELDWSHPDEIKATYFRGSKGVVFS